MKRYIKYIFVNLLALVATGVIIYFARQHAPSWALLPELVWIVVVAAINLIMIAREPRDLRYDLSRACRKSVFREELDSIANSYDEVLAREDFFAADELQGSVSEAYSLIKRQMESNVTSAIDVAMQHPKGKPAESDYLDELEDYSEQLAEKLEQLVEQTIRLRSMRDDVDTSFVTDFIESMDAVLENDDLTYDAYAAKYARAAAAATDEHATDAADTPAAIGEHAAAASAATAPAAAPAEEEGDDD